MNMMQSGFRNYILFTKTVDSDSEKWAQIKYNVYRFIDFSKLKLSKTIELLYFSELKSSKHIELIDFSKLKSYKSIKLLNFSVLKSRASVDFSTVSLYQTKVQLPTGLWDFTTVKCYSGNVVTLYRGNVVACCYGSRLKRGPPAIVPPVSARPGPITALASWAWRAGRKLRAGSWTRAGKLASCVK